MKSKYIFSGVGANRGIKKLHHTSGNTFFKRVKRPKEKENFGQNKVQRNPCAFTVIVY